MKIVVTLSDIIGYGLVLFCILVYLVVNLLCKFEDWKEDRKFRKEKGRNKEK